MNTRPKRMCLQKSPLTGLNVNILAPYFPWGVLGCAIVRVVVDELAEARGEEVEDLERAILVHVAYSWDIVDLLPGGEVPAQRGRWSRRGRTGNQRPCGAGKHYLLQRCIDKIYAGM